MASLGVNFYLQKPAKAINNWGSLDWAIVLARRGVPVYPVAPGTKVPDRLAVHGCNSATVDTAQIRRWWTMRPAANLGICVGEILGTRSPSPVYSVVIDCDNEDVFRLIYGRLSEFVDQTLVVRTARGVHIYGAYCTEGPRVRRSEHVFSDPALPCDVLGSGALVGPGSVRGATSYTPIANFWNPNEKPFVFAELPPVLQSAIGGSGADLLRPLFAELIATPKQPAAVDFLPSTESPQSAGGPRVYEAAPLQERRLRAIWRAAVDRNLRDLRSCAHGSGNATIYRCAIDLWSVLMTCAAAGVIITDDPRRIVLGAVAGWDFRTKSKARTLQDAAGSIEAARKNATVRDVAALLRDRPRG